MLAIYFGNGKDFQSFSICCQLGVCRQQINCQSFVGCQFKTSSVDCAEIGLQSTVKWLFKSISFQLLLAIRDKEKQNIIRSRRPKTRTGVWVTSVIRYNYKKNAKNGERNISSGKPSTSPLICAWKCICKFVNMRRRMKVK